MSETDDKRKFDICKIDLIASILGKNPNEDEINDFIEENQFSKGFSGAEVYKIHSRLGPLPGKFVLKIYNSPNKKEISEQQRFWDSNKLKHLFAKYRISFELDIKSNITQKNEPHNIVFWETAQSSVPLTSMKPLAALENNVEILSALHLLNREILSVNALSYSERDLSFSEICHKILKHKLNPDTSKILPFIYENFRVKSRSPTFLWNDIQFPEPHYYASHSEKIIVRDVFLGECHGDLHGENAFVAIRQNKACGICLIDSGFTANNQVVFYDSAYLEISHILNSGLVVNNSSTDLDKKKQELIEQKEKSEWHDFLSALSNDFILDSAIAHHSPQYTSLLNQIIALREEVVNFINLKQNIPFYEELEKIYRIQQICAGLNYCSKNMDLKKRKFAYLYAAYHLKSYIKTYGDDKKIIEIIADIKAKNSYIENQQLFIQEESGFLDIYKRNWLNLKPDFGVQTRTYPTMDLIRPAAMI